MKKVIYSVAIVATMALASCGGSEVCDCVNLAGEMEKEMKADGADMEKVQEKYKDKMEACKKLGEGKSEEEMKKLQEEAKACEKK
jgi:hypothetical protein